MLLKLANDGRACVLERVDVTFNIILKDSCS